MVHLFVIEWREMQNREKTGVIVKKVIIVGHKQQNCEKISDIFQHLGVKPALPSRREGLSPIEIGALLKKVVRKDMLVSTFGDVPVKIDLNDDQSNKRKKKKKKKLRTVVSKVETVSPVSHSMWDYIPMDLMLANIEQECWGWADSDAIDLLEYWKALDPDILFVLSYEQPQSVLLDLSAEETEALDMQVVRHRLKDWEKYNSKVLKFFLNNQDKSVLINGERIRSYTESSIKVIYNKIVPENIVALPDKVTFHQQSELNEESAVLKLVADNLLNQSLSAKELYMRLQEVANLPLNIEEEQNQCNLALSAWKECNRKHQQLQTNQVQINEIQQALDKQRSLEQQLETQLFGQKKENEILRQDKERVLTELHQENEHLLSQLHIVQEELEKLYLANQKLKEKPPVFGAADRIRNQLTYRIGATLIRNASSVWGWLKMPFLLISAYLDYKKYHKKHMWQKLPKIDTYQDAVEAEKVKKHLSYKLGVVFLKHIKNPIKWVVLPFNLYLTVKEHKKN